MKTNKWAVSYLLLLVMLLLPAKAPAAPPVTPLSIAMNAEANMKSEGRYVVEVLYGEIRKSPKPIFFDRFLREKKIDLKSVCFLNADQVGPVLCEHQRKGGFPFRPVVGAVVGQTETEVNAHYGYGQ